MLQPARGNRKAHLAEGGHIAAPPKNCTKILFWHKADNPTAAMNVRYWTRTDIDWDWR
jgi:hypothetical protein